MNWRFVRPLMAGMALLLACAVGAAAQGGGQLTITLAEADTDTNPGQLQIYGRNFVASNGTLPAVTLAGVPLVVQTVVNTHIQAWLPSGLAPGSYLVVVSRGNGTSQNDSFSVTIGAVGPTGATGSQGAQGEPGPQGDAGAQGSTGPQGVHGETGPQGATGPQGPQGDRGPHGATGDQGPQGATGAQGPEGATGPAGPRGATGAQGPAGPQGVAGAIGPQGPVGPQGPIGPTGLSGNGIKASIHMSFSVDDRLAWTHIETLGDDTCFFNIPLEFTFNGLGTSVSSVSLSSNGLLFFGQNCQNAFNNSHLPTTISADPFLAFFWDDLKDQGPGEYVEYMTVGSAPGRVFNLYFRNRLLSPACGSDTMQVMLSIHEGSNLINATYQGFTSCVQMRGGAATLGIQSANGEQSVLVGFNSPVMDDNALYQSMTFQP